MADFQYGWNSDGTDPNAPLVDPNNPLGAGGAIGSQPGSQTGGQGAGVTPTDMPPTPDPSQGAGAAGTTAGTDTLPQKAAQPTTTTSPETMQTSYDQLLQQVQKATDPQQQALAHDALARNLYSSLSDQGHDVKWDGPNLIVDGRPYQVAGAPGGSFLPGDQYQQSQQAASTAPQAGQFAPTNQGFLDWATQKYGADPTRGGGFVNAAAGGGLQKMLADYAAATGNTANFVGGPSGDQVDFGQGVQDALTSGGQVWNAAGGGGGGVPAPGGAPSGQWGPMPTAPAGGSQWDDAVKAALARQTDFSVPNVQPGQLPSDLQNWRPGTGPTYTPGEIGFGDIPDFTYQSLLDDSTKGTAGLDTLMQNIIANPESLDQKTVDTMKAQMKGTVAEQQQQEEEDLKGFGAASGIGDSGWLAAQRAQSRRARDMGVAKGAQDIDITAAQTRMGDRRAAAELGVKYASGKTAAMQAASDASLKKASITGDRMQLREQVKQQAAQLGIAADTVMNNFIGNQQDNLMKRYGIDMGASIDMKKLGEQSQEFKEGLAQKMSELEQSLAMQKYGIDVGAGTSRYGIDVSAQTSEAARQQQDQQFAAGLGLDYQKFNQATSQDDWKRLMDLYGQAGAA